MTLIRTVSPQRRRGALALVATAALTLSAAGCGGGSPPSLTNSASGQSQAPHTIAASAYKFSACMRSHGLTNFPDPVVKTSAGGASVGIRITPTLSSSPRFKAAQSACQGILPKGGNGPDSSPAGQRARTQALLAFAQCLRQHGFPRFPDPDAHGQLSLQMLNAAGINLHTPALLTAGKSCTSVTHGQITPAQVVRAINGPH